VSNTHFSTNVTTAIAIFTTAILVLTACSSRTTITTSSSRISNSSQSSQHCNNGDPAVISHSDETTFTRTAIEQYIKTHAFAGGLTISGKKPIVNEILLISSHDASMLMKGEYVGVPDNKLVWYVQYCGPFLLDWVPYGVKPPTYPLGQEVFDAQTGQMLLWGER